MDILQNILTQVLDNSTIENISKQLNAKPEQVKDATTMLIPTLMKGLNTNVQSKEGLNSLSKALEKHSNTDISNVNNFFNSVDLLDGKKIIDHIFNKNDDQVKKEVAKKSGLSQANTQMLMAMLAPLLMGFLGNQKKESKGFDAKSLIDLLSPNFDPSSILKNIFTQKENKTSTNKKVVKVEKEKSKGNDLLESLTDVLGSFLGGK